MSDNEKQGFWKNYGLSIVLVAVIIITVVLIKFLQPADQTENVDNPVLQKTGVSSGLSASGNSEQIAFPREVLTKDAIVNLTNNARTQSGLSPLKENQLLNSVAQSRAQDMLDKQYFAHVSPTGQQASDIAQTVGYHYKIIAENIGNGDFLTNQKIIDGWMQSPGHRANILSTDVQEIGAAVLRGNMKDRETYVAVQIFALESPPVSQKICVSPSKKLLDDINQKKAEIDSLNGQLGRLRNELDAEKEYIEKDRKNTEGDSVKIQKLNARVNAFNEKISWYNKLLGEVSGKINVSRSMISEYNKALQEYNDCQLSH